MHISFFFHIFARYLYSMARRLRHMALIFALLLSGLMNYVQAATYSGTCGASLSWTLDDADWVLTISGTGEMDDYYSTPTPWSAYSSQIKRVIFSNGITKIGGDAFANCTALTTVNFPNKITNIGSRAFQYTDLRTITLSAGMTALNHWVFRGCSNLTTVHIPKNITSFPTPGAFCDCNSLADVYVLWETTSEIPTCENNSNFFHNLSTKPTLHVPCGTVALYQSKGWAKKFVITETIVGSGTCGTNVNWSLNCDGVLTISGSGAMKDYNLNNGVTTAPWKVHVTSIRSVVIGEGVTKIGDYAFYTCNNITSVTIPSSVTSIGNYAFQNTALTSITIPNSVNIIGTYTFSNTALSSLTIPSSVTTIGAYAFSNTSLTDIYVSWTTEAAIPAWSNLTNISPLWCITLHVPCGTETIYRAKEGWGTCAIEPDCATSYTLTVSSNDAAKGKVAIDGGEPGGEWSQTVHNGASHYLTATVASPCYSFVRWSDGNTTNPRQVIISGDATYTAEFAAGNGGTCSAAGSNVTWSLSCDGVLRISGTGVMKSYSTTGSSSSAPWDAYKNFIRSVVIDEGVTSVGSNAFYNCRNITSITFPSSINAFGSNTFLYTSLTDIYVPWTTEAAIPAWNNMTNSTELITLHVPCGTGDLYRAKAGWQDYIMVTDCSESYTLTVSVSNSGMGKVKIDNGVPGVSVSQTVHRDEQHIISTVPIDGCHALTKWKDGNTDDPRSVVITGNASYTATLAKTGETMASGSCGAHATYVLSCDSVLTISGTGDIQNDAFRNESRIKSVVINEGITKIGTLAFSNCTNMEYISFPSTLTNIGYDGTPGSTTDGHVFYCCYKLKHIYIPASVRNIGIWPLLRCNDLETIEVDPANTVYDSRSNCNAIIETATNKMIAGCMHTVMPHTTEIIDTYCFEYLHKLKSMVIASSVRTFNGYTFKECENLKDIYVEWTENIPVWNNFTSWQEHRNENMDAGITLHVPCGTKARYQAAPGWRNYNIVDDHMHSGICGVNGSNLTWMLSCDGTLTIRGNGAMQDWGVSENKPWEAYKGSITTVIVEDGVTNIGNCAFYNYKQLTSVTLPESLEVIGNYAFYSCTALKSVTIPSHVTTIGDYAFYSCKALKSVTIPNSVTTIGMRAFANCPYIFDIYVSWTSNIPTCPYEFTTSNNPTLHVPCRTRDLYVGRWADYHIVDNMPNVKEGTWETNIHWSMNYCDSTLTIDGSGEFRCDYGMWAFGEFDRYYVKRAVISKDITYLGIYTLSSCPNLEYIDVEAGNPTHRSGYNAIIRNGNGTEGDTLMFGCKNTVIPPTVTAIRGYAFWDSHKVTEMRIPVSVNEIGNSNYPQSGLWLLGQGKVFYTSDTEGEGLKDLYVEWMTKENIPVLKSNTLGDMSKVRLHVPCGMAAMYQEVEGWKNFKEYIEEATSYTVTVQTATGDTSMGSVSITVP